MTFFAGAHRNPQNMPASWKPLTNITATARGPHAAFRKPACRYPSPRPVLVRKSRGLPSPSIFPASRAVRVHPQVGQQFVQRNGGGVRGRQDGGPVFKESRSHLASEV